MVSWLNGYYPVVGIGRSISAVTDDGDGVVAEDVRIAIRLNVNSRPENSKSTGRTCIHVYKLKIL